MKLLYRLLLAPLVAVILMVLLSLIAFQAQRTQKAALDDLTENALVGINAITRMRANILRTHAGVYRVFTWTGSLGESYAEKESKALMSAFDAELPKFTQWMVSPVLDEEDRKAAKELESIAKVYRKTIADAIDMASMDMNTGIAMMQTADEQFRKLSTIVDKMVEKEQKEAEAAQKSATETYQRSISLTIISLLIAAVSAALISLLIARKISGQISEAARVAGRVAQGDLTGQLPNAGEDEIGQLLQALGRMQNDLRGVVSEISQHATHLGQSANTMRDSSGSIDDAVRQQSESITSTAAAIEEMTASIGQVSENAESARSIAQRTAEIALNGKQLVSGASSEINKIAQTVQTTATAMHDLQSSSQEISNIANVIRDIADQTNLLALNAAIEAARAGEAGRGFAVVADEVRKLAEKTAVATNEIKTMIERIQSQSDQAAAQMRAASGQVDSGVELIGNLRTPLDELNNCSNQALSALVELADAVREQQSTSLSITRNVETIAQSSETTASNAADGSQIAREVAQTASTLSTVVARFRT